MMSLVSSAGRRGCCVAWWLSDNFLKNSDFAEKTLVGSGRMSLHGWSSPRDAELGQRQTNPNAVGADQMRLARKHCRSVAAQRIPRMMVMQPLRLPPESLYDRIPND
jgi:hypothetical protein